MNVLRQGTVIWSGRRLALEKARVRIKEGIVKSGPNKGKPKYKFHWKCAKCLKLFRDENQVEVDHIFEIGGFRGCWNRIIEAMYCSPDNLAVLCVACHLIKTERYNSARSRYQRK